MNPENLNKLLQWGILLLAVLLVFSLAAAQAIVVIMVLIWIFKIVLVKKINIKKTPLLYPYLVFIIARIISIFFSVNISESIQILNREIFFYLLLFIFIDVFPVKEKKFVKNFLLILIVAAVIAAVYGTSKVLLGIEERASSTTSGYSTLGMFLTISLSVLLPLGRNKYFFSSRFIWILFILIILTGILFTWNRTHWGIAGLIFILIGFYREKKIMLLTAVFAALLIVVIPSLSERFYQIIHFLQNASDRDIIWKGALEIFYKHPVFGFGPRTFRTVFPLFDQLVDKGISSWHCDYLQLYMDSGILGLTAFLWLMVSIFFNLIKLLQNKNINNFYKDIVLAIALSMTAFYLTAVVGDFIFDPITSLLFQVLLGLLILVKINIKELISEKEAGT